MAEKTQHYKLETFSRGSLYSASSDRRRFTTLDYNLESYVGIIGVGIISGWTIESIGGLKIVINSGNGIIDGYFAESPYVVKRRSQMDIPDREIEIVRFDSDPEPYMSTDESNDYIDVIQNYNSSFNPSIPIENTYIKSVIPHEILLNDNSQTFIYASFPSGWTPYPKLNDAEYNSFFLIEPLPENYPDYLDYLEAMNTYNEELLASQAYKWQLHSENHFTEVQFETFSSAKNVSTKVFLGSVLTRNGEVIKIDVSKIDSLENLKSSIKKKANAILKNHKHGGNKPFDPSFINISTNVREGVLYEYDPQTGVAIYDIIDKNKTSTEQSHSHTYSVDDNGNGTTFDCSGFVEKHYHIITNFVLSNVVTDTIPEHSHLILNGNDNFIDTWKENDAFNVYANNVVLGNNSSENVTLDFANKTLKINGSIGIQYKTYFTSFKFYNGATAKEEIYSFKKSTFNSYSFWVSLVSDFNNKFGYLADSFLEIQLPIKIDFFKTANSEDINSVKKQMEIIDRLIIAPGDNFIVPPELLNATNIEQDISINILKSQSASNPYKIKIEVLGSIEVSGVLRKENISYIHADKIISGKFDIARIPFISHVGRLNETFLPNQLPMTSQEGIKYNILPYLTDIQYGHYHTLSLNKDINGNSINTMIGNDAVIYAESNGINYFIDHDHFIKNGVVDTVESDSIEKWQTSIGNEALTKHTHAISYPTNGDSKTIYSIAQDPSENIWVGTSNGLILIPSSNAYYIVINEYKTFQIGDNLWDLILKVKSEYEQSTKIPFNISSDYESIINTIESNLDSNDKSQTILIQSDDYLPTNQLTITRKEYIELKQIYSHTEKEPFEIEPEDTITDINIVDVNGKTISTNDSSLPSLIENKKVKLLFSVKKDVSNVPMWGISLRKTSTSDSGNPCSDDGDITVESVNIVGGSVFVSNSDFVDNPNKEWEMGVLPAHITVCRKTLSDSNGNTWITTDNGIYIKRKSVTDNKFNKINSPETSLSINDIVEFDYGKILCATNLGVYSTIDQGKTWTKLIGMDLGCTDLLVDYTTIKTDALAGHYHAISYDSYGNGHTGNPSNGVNHIHTISNKDILTANGHTHASICKIYAIENKDTIYVSSNNGEVWEIDGTTPFGEKGKFFAFRDCLFTSTKDGIHKWDGYSWSIVNKNIAFSFSMSGDMASMLIGCCNIILQTYDGNIFTELFKFSGCPQYLLSENNQIRNFGFSYSNRESSVYFDSITTQDRNRLMLVDFSKWIAEKGSWADNVNYEIFLDKKLVLSKNNNIDLRGSECPQFTVYPSNGMVDFGAITKIENKVLSGENSIVVSSSVGFYIGDKILIKYNGETPKYPDIENVTLIGSSVPNGSLTRPEDLTGQQLLEKYETTIENINKVKDQIFVYIEKTNRISAMYKHAIIKSINGNKITIDGYFEDDFDMPSIVQKLPYFDQSSSVLSNIYDSYLTDNGKITHEEIEDKLSTISTGMPFKLANSYLANILQLAQASKYVYPNIDDKMKNMKLYDMHYSWGDNDIYPNIEEYIDTYNSYINTKSLYESSFSISKSRTINDIAFGKGQFIGKIFIGTDIGLFWGNNSNSHENNWWYIGDIPYVVFKIKIQNSRILVGTSNGLYITSDMITWTRQQSGAVDFSCHDISFRWDDHNITTILDKECSFSNELDLNGNEIGVIESEDSIFINISPNNNVRIKSSDLSINGNYIIQSVSESRMTVTPSFDSNVVPMTDGGVDMVIASWWAEFNEDENTGNSNLNNPIIISGENAISISMYPDDLKWQSAEIKNINNDYMVDGLTPLTNGTIVSLSNTINTEIVGTRQSNVLKSSDSGLQWDIIKKIETSFGKIINISITNDGHTKLLVSYDSKIPSNGEFQNKYIDIKEYGKNIFSGSIIWNEYDEIENQHIIYVYGQGIISSIGNRSNLIFSISPQNLNSIVETDTNEILFGTSIGLFSDKKSIMNKNSVSGQVLSVGRHGSVVSIDVDGLIKHAQINSSTGNLTITITTSISSIFRDQLAGKKLYMRNMIPSQSFDIISNSSLRNNEITIEVNTKYSTSWILNVGKRVTIAGGSSRIYVSFKSIVDNDEFKDGYIYFKKQIMVNGIIKDAIERHKIISNSKTYIDMDYLIDWTKLYSIEAKEENGSIISEGIDFIMTGVLDSIELTVSIDRDIMDGSLSNFNITSPSMNYSKYILTPSINKNTRNKIFLNPITTNNAYISTINTTEKIPSEVENGSFSPWVFSQGSRFNLQGVCFERIKDFNDKKTSIVSSHFHDVKMMNKNITGVIQAIAVNGTDSNKIDISLANTIGMDDPILLLDEKLLNGEIVYFFNKLNVENILSLKVYAINSNVISVYGDKNVFDMLDYNENLISNNWNVFIDTSCYGKTENIYYNDFNGQSILLIEDAIISNLSIVVATTSGIQVGDKVNMIDGLNNIYVNYIESIDGPNELSLKTRVARSMYVKDRAYIRVLKDSNSNNHYHLIRKKRIESIRVSDYVQFGYPLAHSHEITPRILNVHDVVKNDQLIVTSGSSSIMYKSLDEGNNWTKFVDLNYTSEKEMNINSITKTVIDNNGGFVSGTDSGDIYFQLFSEIEAEELTKPYMD